MTPPDLLKEIWPAVQPMVPDLKCRLVPYVCCQEEARRFLANLGEEIDVIPSVFDEDLLQLRGCEGLALSECHAVLCIPFGHRLWQAEPISMDDLDGETILCIHEGWSHASDEVRHLLESHETINVETIDFYNPDVMVDCINEKKLIVAFEAWKDLYPLMHFVDAGWNCSLSYGLLHAPTSPQGGQRFLEALKKADLPALFSEPLKSRKSEAEANRIPTGRKTGNEV